MIPFSGQGRRGVIKVLGKLGHALEFLKDQYRHAKPILALREGADLVENAGAAPVLPSGKPDPGVLLDRKATAEESLPAFIEAIARHRHHERFSDPPDV